MLLSVVPNMAASFDSTLQTSGHAGLGPAISRTSLRPQATDSAPPNAERADWVSSRVHPFREFSAVCRGCSPQAVVTPEARSQGCSVPQNLCKQRSWDHDFGHLKDTVTAVSKDFASLPIDALPRLVSDHLSSASRIAIHLQASPYFHYSPASWPQGHPPPRRTAGEAFSRLAGHT